MKYNIAIDGPAAAGKSTIARLVANELGFIYVDTGAMYRAVTWKVLKQGISCDDRASVIELARETDIRLLPGAVPQVYVDGSNVTDEIRSPIVTSNVSYVAAIGEVRELLVAKQKQLASAKGVVMDGRDIGTQVIPDAEVKIFMTASVKKRAVWRFMELQANHPEITLEQLEQDIARRDKLDQEREVSPLVRAEDAILLDSTDLTIPQVVQRILEICKSRQAEGCSR